METLTRSIDESAGGDDIGSTLAALTARAQGTLEHALLDLSALAAVDPGTARVLAGKWATRFALTFGWEKEEG